MLQISSGQNPKYKLIKSLLKPKGRKKEGLFLAEGQKEVLLAIRKGFVAEFICFSDAFVSMDEAVNIAGMGKVSPVVVHLSRELFEGISYQHIPGNIVGVFREKKCPAKEVSFSSKPLVLVLERLEKPGNLGAILRTADAVGVEAVFLTSAHFDLYNPNVIRNSRGAVFTLPVVECTNEEAEALLRNLQCQVLAAELNASTSYLTEDFAKATALVFGAESSGLSPFWLEKAHQNIIIPMNGVSDSLNVSVSVAVILYEAFRQRNLP